MSKQSMLASILKAMPKEKLRNELTKILEKDDDLLDNFIAKHLDPKDDFENPETLKMIEDRALNIAVQIQTNVSDERTLWEIARMRHGSRYLDEGDAFHAAVEDELWSARVYAGELAKKGHVRLALEFSRIAEKEINAALNCSDYPAEWVGFDITDIWEGILQNADKFRKEAFEVILEAVEAEEGSYENIDFLCRHPELAFAERLIKILDKRIANMRSDSTFRENLRLPWDVSQRTNIMKATGATEDDVNNYLTTTFKDCAFGLTKILMKAEERKDAKEAISACKALLALKLPVEVRQKLSGKLAQYQFETGDTTGETETLRAAVEKCAAELPELRRLRELLPATEWAALLDGFVSSTSKNTKTYPGIRNCGCLLRDVKDWDRLWELVRTSSMKQDWLCFADSLEARHPDEYGDFLLSHLGPDESQDEFFRVRRKQGPVAETYTAWAETIQRAAKVPGQHEKAMKVAQDLAAKFMRSKPFRIVWSEAGLPGFTTPKVKRAMKK